MPAKQAAGRGRPVRADVRLRQAFLRVQPHRRASCCSPAATSRTSSAAANFHNTMFRLLELGALPVINENDTVATDGDRRRRQRHAGRDRRAATVAGGPADPALGHRRAVRPPTRGDDPKAELDSHRGRLIDGASSPLGGRQRHRAWAPAAWSPSCAPRSIACRGRHATWSSPTATRPSGHLSHTWTGEPVGTRFDQEAAAYDYAGKSFKAPARRGRSLAAADTAAEERRARSHGRPAAGRRTAEILAANALDVAAARGTHLRCDDRPAPALTTDRIARHGRWHPRRSPRSAIRSGRVLATRRASRTAWCIDKIGVPLGVIAIIYESRPNVTSDAAALCRQERQRLRAARRQGGLPLGRAPSSRRCGRALAAGGLPTRTASSSWRTPAAPARSELMTAVGSRRSAHPPRRRGADPRLRRERHRPLSSRPAPASATSMWTRPPTLRHGARASSTTPRPAGPSVCNAEEVLPGPPGRRGAVPARCSKKRLVDDRAAAGQVPGRAAAGPRRRADHRRHPRRASVTSTPNFSTTSSRSGVVDSVDAAIAHIAAHSTGHSDCHRRPSDAAAAQNFTAAGGQRGGLRQRLHPLHRRRRVRPRLRDGHLHPEAPRPRPHGARRAVYLQIRRPRQRTDPVRRDA